MSKVMFAPTGLAIVSVTVVCVTGCPAEFELDGEPEQGAFNDFPDFACYTTVGDNVRFVVDRDGTEFLARHCRVAEVGHDFDVWGDGRNKIDAWDERIIDACIRVARLSDGVRQLANLTPLLPTGWLDATCQAVIDTILLGRMNSEIAELDAAIDAYRAGRVEVAHVNEMPCPTCDGQGGDLLPCDECGAGRNDEEDTDA